MRTFEETHPWLTFRLDLRETPFDVWMALGEVQASCRNVASVPLEPEIAERLHQHYLAKGALATTAIEGNTLTEEQVIQHLNGELHLPPSKEYLAREVQNIVEACDAIARSMLEGRSGDLSTDLLREFNGRVLADLPLGEDVYPGRIREHPVVVGKYRGAPPEDCHYLMDRLCGWLAESFQAPPGYEMAFGVLKAIVAHLYIAWIHPFGDGNGRTARLAEFQLLLGAGAPVTTAHLLSNHYNLTRTQYYRHLELASKSSDGPLAFVRYAVQGFAEGLREQEETIRRQQLRVHWMGHVHGIFSERDTPAARRQRDLVLALSDLDSPVPRSRLRHITGRMAEAYAGKTDRTIFRDLTALERLKLIERTREGIRARTEIMKAFLPPARP